MSASSTSRTVTTYAPVAKTYPAHKDAKGPFFTYPGYRGKVNRDGSAVEFNEPPQIAFGCEAVQEHKRFAKPSHIATGELNGGTFDTFLDCALAVRGDMGKGAGVVTIAGGSDNLLGEYEHTARDGSVVVTVKDASTGKNISKKHEGMSCTYTTVEKTGEMEQYAGTIAFDKSEKTYVCRGMEYVPRSTKGWGDDTGKKK